MSKLLFAILICFAIFACYHYFPAQTINAGNRMGNVGIAAAKAGYAEAKK